MSPNRWSVHLKPVNFCQCRFRAKRPPDKPHTQRSEGAWSVPDSSRAPRAVRTETNNSHRATTKRDAVCPHLWITMWTAVIVSLVDPQPSDRGFTSLTADPDAPFAAVWNTVVAELNGDRPGGT